MWWGGADVVTEEGRRKPALRIRVMSRLRNSHEQMTAQSEAPRKPMKPVPDGGPCSAQPHKWPAKGWSDRKTQVASIVERGGKIRSFVMTDATGTNLGITSENVGRDLDLMTHSSLVYARSEIG